jgi:dehydrogenase/reductase SDR family protein 7B
LHHTRIGMTLLCAGYIKTDISFHSVRGDGEGYGAMDDQHRTAMPASTFAHRAMRAIGKRKPVVFIGGLERFAPLLQRLSPGLVRWLLPRVITRD